MCPRCKQFGWDIPQPKGSIKRALGRGHRQGSPGCRHDGEKSWDMGVGVQGAGTGVTHCSTSTAGAPQIAYLVNPLVEATIMVYTTITSQLLPTPAKSHYTFNLRDLSKVFQGVLMADPARVAVRFERPPSLVPKTKHPSAFIGSGAEEEWGPQMAQKPHPASRTETLMGSHKTGWGGEQGQGKSHTT